MPGSLRRKYNDTLKVPNPVLRLHPSAAMLSQLGLPAAQTGKQEIYVLRAGKLQAVPATFGLSDGKFTAITADSLQANEAVVVRFTTSTSAPSTGSSAPSPSAPRRGPRI